MIVVVVYLLLPALLGIALGATMGPHRLKLAALVGASAVEVFGYSAAYFWHSCDECDWDPRFAVFLTALALVAYGVGLALGVAGRASAGRERIRQE